VWDASGNKAHQNHGSGLQLVIHISPRRAALLNILHQSTLCNLANVIPVCIDVIAHPISLIFDYSQKFTTSHTVCISLILQIT